MGCIGVIQLTTEQMRIGEVGVCNPMGVMIVAAIKGALQTYPFTILVTVYQPLLPIPIDELLSRHFTYVQLSDSSLVHYYFEASSFGTLSPKLSDIRLLLCPFG